MNDISLGQILINYHHGIDTTIFDYLDINDLYNVFVYFNYQLVIFDNYFHISACIQHRASDLYQINSNRKVAFPLIPTIKYCITLCRQIEDECSHGMSLVGIRPAGYRKDAANHCPMGI